MIPESVIDYENKHPLEPAPWELPGHDCKCGVALEESETICWQCLEEAAEEAASIVAGQTVAAGVPDAIDDAFDALDMTAAAYKHAAKIGSLALLGWSLGSLAVLARAL